MPSYCSLESFIQGLALAVLSLQYVKELLFLHLPPPSNKSESDRKDRTIYHSLQIFTELFFNLFFEELLPENNLQKPSPKAATKINTSTNFSKKSQLIFFKKTKQITQNTGEQKDKKRGKEEKSSHKREGTAPPKKGKKGKGRVD